jgi:hypothetical protein
MFHVEHNDRVFHVERLRGFSGGNARNVAKRSTWNIAGAWGTMNHHFGGVFHVEHSAVQRILMIMSHLCLGLGLNSIQETEICGFRL